jgi:hypothetical protein
VTPAIAELAAPALFVAGATSSLHCALMCGAINAAQAGSRGPVPLRHALALVHGGRVLGYALLGLLAGALGARLALWLPGTAGGMALQGLAALALVVAGLQQWRGRNKGVGSVPCHASRGKMDLTPFFSLPPRARLFAQGLLWALMPCGILYTVVLLAGLTASPVTGFFLLAAFGLGTVPLMGASGGLLALAARPQRARGLRRAAGGLLVTLGLAALGGLALGGDALAALWCAPGA